MKSLNRSRVISRRNEIIRDALRAKEIPMDQIITEGINFIISAFEIAQQRDKYIKSWGNNSDE
ncbi:MAG: hypothetical protein INQ03_14370 [Candidatus Heimdallarchaeota archaeon]|nr:hypothetical protein [Candidatus Heimdallarchaeota archaeon]